MQGFGSARFGHFDNFVDVEVALRGRGGPQMISFLGEFDVKGAAVYVRVDGHGDDSHFAAGPDDTDGDLAAVGDQNFFKHAN